MAIYHLHAQMVKRAEGESSVAGAAYHSASLVYEESTGITHDYTRKRGVEHSEILAPEDTPAWVHDRHTLWNTVEARERRKDAQVAREIEVGLPVLSKNEQLALLRGFVKREFVSKGMVADIGIHRDNPHNHHAHILLTARDLTADGFGQKSRSWNETQQLLAWRRGWAEVTNEHLIDAGLGVRIDHRSCKDQQLDLIPGRKLGVDQQRQATLDLPAFLADRAAEQQRIANGAEILKDPAIVLKTLRHANATFTHHDVARFLHTHTMSAAQFQSAYAKVTNSAELVHLCKDEAGMIGTRHLERVLSVPEKARQSRPRRRPRAAASDRSRHPVPREQRTAWPVLVDRSTPPQSRVATHRVPRLEYRQNRRRPRRLRKDGWHHRRRAPRRRPQQALGPLGP